MRILQVDPGRFYLNSRGLQQGLGQGRVVIRFGLEKVPVFRIEGALKGHGGGTELLVTQKGRTRSREAPLARCFEGEVTSIATDQMWEDGGPKCRPEGWEGRFLGPG